MSIESSPDKRSEAILRQEGVRQGREWHHHNWFMITRENSRKGTVGDGGNKEEQWRNKDGGKEDQLELKLMHKNKKK